MIDVTKCQDARKTQKEKYIQCQACGMYFKHDKKGRKPKTCDWYKAKESKEAEQLKKAKKEAQAKGDFVSIPNLEPIPSVDVLREDMVVYYVHNDIKDEVLRQQYASEYKILNIEDDATIEVVRNAKHGHKNYPLKENFNRFYIKNGYTYTKKVRKEEVNE